MKEIFACPAWSKIGGILLYPKHAQAIGFTAELCGIGPSGETRRASSDIDTRHLQALDFHSRLFDINLAVIYLRYDVLLGLQKH